MCVQTSPILAQSTWIIEQVAWGTSPMKATPVKFQGFAQKQGRIKNTHSNVLPEMLETFLQYRK